MNGGTQKANDDDDGNGIGTGTNTGPRSEMTAEWQPGEPANKKEIFYKSHRKGIIAVKYISFWPLI